jgi:hypothetical protein
MPIIKTFVDVSSTLTGKLTTIEDVELNEKNKKALPTPRGLGRRNCYGWMDQFR